MEETLDPPLFDHVLIMETPSRCELVVEHHHSEHCKFHCILMKIISGQTKKFHIKVPPQTLVWHYNYVDSPENVWGKKSGLAKYVVTSTMYSLMDWIIKGFLSSTPSSLEQCYNFGLQDLHFLWPHLHWKQQKMLSFRLIGISGAVRKRSKEHLMVKQITSCDHWIVTVFWPLNWVPRSLASHDRALALG